MSGEAWGALIAVWSISILGLGFMRAFLGSDRFDDIEPAWTIVAMLVAPAAVLLVIGMGIGAALRKDGK